MHSLFLQSGLAIGRLSSHWAFKSSRSFNLRHLPHSQTLERHYSSSQRGVRIIEVSPRDGLQNIKPSIPTATKIELIKRLARTGIRDIEATSFVSPSWVPQLADGAEVMTGIGHLLNERSLNFPVLAPNLKGLENANKAGVKEIVVFASATEAFSQANQNCSVAEALMQAESTTKEAMKQGMKVRGMVSCIFSDPFSGPTSPETVLSIVQRLLEMGCYEVGLGDTLGVGTPRATQNLLEVLLKAIPAGKLAGHFHDTYGQGVANIVRAYDMGIRTFDSSVAGLGGCPYAPGAKGNVATEDVVYTMENSGINTGVDIDKLVNVGQWISREIGKENGSRVGTALVARSGSILSPAQKKFSTYTSERAWDIVEDTGEYRISRAGTVMKITLCRSKNGNALTDAMLDGLTNVFHGLAQETSIYQVVIESEGKYFCTGMDLSGSTNTAGDESNYYKKVASLYHAIDHAPQTTIAVVDGPCFGGGVGLTFVCDVRFVSTRARWTLSEVKIGVSPAIISKYLVREWGVSMAREGMISGREIKPEELYRVGAIHAIVRENDSLNSKLDKYLDQLEKSAPRSVAINKELTRIAWYAPESKTQADMIEKIFGEMMSPGSEGEHGIQQFQKKTKNFSWREFWGPRNAIKGLNFKGSPRL